MYVEIEYHLQARSGLPSARRRIEGYQALPGKIHTLVTFGALG